MSTPPKRKVKTFWSRVEQVGESMELGARALLGLLFAFVFAGLAWQVGSHVWAGLSFIIALIAWPIGFVIGFFWLEVKFMIQLVFRFWIG